LGYNIFGFFNQRFLIELFYNKYITGLVLRLGGQTTKIIDKGSVELLGPYGLEKGLINLSRNIASLDTGVITSYALYILIGLIFYIIFPYVSLFDNSLVILMLLSLFSVITNNSNNFKTNANVEASVLGSLLKHFTPINIMTSCFGLVVIFLFKEYNCASLILNMLDISCSESREWAISSFSGIISRLGFKGIVEDYLFQLMPLAGPLDRTYFLSNPFSGYAPPFVSGAGSGKAPVSGYGQTSGSGTNIPLDDSEAIRQEKVRKRILEEQKASSSKPNLEDIRIKEDNSLISSAKEKLDVLAAYNKRNGQKIGVKANIPEYNIIALTDSEIKAITDKIKYDSNSSEFLDPQKFGSGKIKCGITPNSPLLKYLNSLNGK
jgi:hypothetical protein